MLRIQAREIPASVGLFLKRIGNRFVFVVYIMLGENTETDLVKDVIFQGFQCFSLDLLRLMRPRVAGGADRIVGGRILIGEMVCPAYANGAMIARRSGRYRKASGLLALCKIGGQAERILLLKRRLEPYAVFSDPIVKAAYRRRFALAFEFCGYLIIHKGVPVRRTLHSKLLDTPFFYCFQIIYHEPSSCSGKFRSFLSAPRPCARDALIVILRSRIPAVYEKNR